MDEHHHNDEPPHVERRRPPGMIARLRSSFLTGLVVVLPIALTVWVIWTVTGWIDGWVLPFIPQQFQPQQYIGIDLRGIGVIIFLVFTVFAGWMAKGFIGRSLIRWGEQLVDRTPVVRSIYNGLKQIAETVFAQSETNFDKACLIEYPRKGVWMVGFISSSAKGEVAEKLPLSEPYLSVFVPTTPNPTSGFLIFVPKSELIELDLSIEDSAKLVISAGLVYPSPKDARTAVETISPDRRRSA